jgi:phosphoribosylanthranilate isomerase
MQTHRTRVKICGITRPEDGLAAAQAGADAIGLVFYPPSARHVDTLTAQRIVAALPPFVTVVGLFVDAEPAWLRRVLSRVPIHLLQFHGNEEPGDCAAFGLPYLKAVPMQDGPDLAAYSRRFQSAAGLLLDNFGGSRIGGSGERFDWALIPAGLRQPLILAGGLDTGNVAEAVRRFRPFAVDVSSGVESAKGIKDPTLITTFIKAVAEGDNGV